MIIVPFLVKSCAISGERNLEIKVDVYCSHAQFAV